MQLVIREKFLQDQHLLFNLFLKLADCGREIK